jgi:hypothetical protein
MGAGAPQVPDQALHHMLSSQQRGCGAGFFGRIFSETPDNNGSVAKILSSSK